MAPTFLDTDSQKESGAWISSFADTPQDPAIATAYNTPIDSQPHVKRHCLAMPTGTAIAHVAT